MFAWFGKALVLGLSILFLSIALALGAGEDYPSRPIIINVGFAAGGSAGVSSQIFADTAKKYLPRPQPMVVNFKPGAAQAIAASYILSQPADGYNLLWADTGLIVKMAKDAYQLNFKKDDFIYVGTVAVLPYLLLVNKESPYKKLEDFIDSAKKNPGKLSYGSAGIGSFSHLIVEIVQMRSGIKLNHIPFAGAAGYTTALLGGHIDCSPVTLSSSGDHIKAGGGLRPLTVFASQRLPELPDAPTFLEKGYDIDLATWHYLVAPKGTPQPVLNILFDVYKKTVEDPQVKAALSRGGFMPVNWEHERTTKKVNEAFELAREVLKKAGLLQ